MSSGVQFEEDSFSFSRPRVPGASGSYAQNSAYSNYSAAGNEPKMVQWLIRKGWVKTPNGAQAVLVGVIIINIIITVVVIRYFI